MLARIDFAETDAGARATTAVRQRMCIVARQVRPVAEMIRFVIGPDGVVVPDIKRKLPGRGVWVTAQRQTVAEAVKCGAFSRAFRMTVKVADDLPATVERLLERSVLDALAIVHKAGEVVTGFAQVKAQAAKGRFVALLHAAEASPEGVRKIAATLRRKMGEDAKRVVVVETLTSTQLDLALDCPNVVHAALLAGRASETFLARWRTLERYRATGPGERGRGVRQPNEKTPGLGSE